MTVAGARASSAGMGASPRYDVCHLVRNTLTVDGRVEREATFLAAHGLRTLVLAQHGPGLEVRERREGFDVERLAAAGADPFEGPERGSLGRLRRLARTLRFYAGAVRRAVAARPGTVHCHDLDTLVPGAIAARLIGARLVYDAHELWLDRNHGLTGARRRVDRLKYGLIERLLIRRTERVITVSEGIADTLERRYTILRPVVLRNVPAPGDQGCGGLRLAVGWKGPLWLYVGAVRAARGLEGAIAALSRLPDVCLVLLGPARPALLATLGSQAERLGVRHRLVHLPPVPRAQILAWTREATLGLCAIEPACLSYELCLPNKFFDYAMAGVPVVASDLPELRAWVRRYKLGALCDPRDPDDMARAVRDILEGRAPRASRAEREAFRATFAWEREAVKLADAYPELASRLAGLKPPPAVYPEHR